MQFVRATWSRGRCQERSGIEEPINVSRCCPCCTVDEDGIHLLDDGNFYYEVEGLPDVDLDDVDSSVQAKKPDKVKFSSSPMKVRTVC